MPCTLVKVHFRPPPKTLPWRHLVQMADNTH